MEVSKQQIGKRFHPSPLPLQPRAKLNDSQDKSFSNDDLKDSFQVGADHRSHKGKADNHPNSLKVTYLNKSKQELIIWVKIYFTYRTLLLTIKQGRR